MGPKRYRVELKRATAFKTLVDHLASVAHQVVVRIGDGGGLVVWTPDGGTVVATYPPRKKEESHQQFVIDVVLLSLVLECAHPKDSLSVEWSGRDTLNFTVEHLASRRCASIELPILRGTTERVPSELPCARHTLRISASTWSTRVLGPLIEGAGAKAIRVVMTSDAVEFSVDPSAPFGCRMTVWHPTHPVRMSAEFPALRVDGVSAERLRHTAGLKLIDAVLDVGIVAEVGLVFTSRGKDGLVLTQNTI